MSNVTDRSQTGHHFVSPVRRRATLLVLALGSAVALFVARPTDAADEQVRIVSEGDAVTAEVTTTETVPSFVPTFTTEDFSTTSVPEGEGTNDFELDLDEVEASTSTTEEAAPSTTEAQTRMAAAPAEPAPPTTEAPRQTTTTAPPPPQSSSRSEDPESVIREIFGGHGDDAVTIARCESGMNPRAHNPAGYHGLFQIGDHHAARFEQVTGTDWESGRYESRPNTVYAKYLFDGSGWSQWGCRHKL